MLNIKTFMPAFKLKYKFKTLQITRILQKLTANNNTLQQILTCKNIHKGSKI